MDQNNKSQQRYKNNMCVDTIQTIFVCVGSIEHNSSNKYFSYYWFRLEKHLLDVEGKADLTSSIM